MDLNLTDRVVLVSGASRGIGAATAHVLAAEGARLMLVARDRDALQAVASSAGAGAGQIAIHATDLTAPIAPAAAVGHALATFGRLDALVVCSGTSVGGDPLQVSEDGWRQTFELKFFGTLRLIQAALVPMRAQRRGVVLTVGGNIGRQPNPMMLPGSAVNAALQAVSKGLGDHCARDGVRFHVLNPGPTRTERLVRYVSTLAERSGVSVEQAERQLAADSPQQRIIEPGEIAALAAWMVSDRFACTTGNQVTADAGATRGIF